MKILASKEKIVQINTEVKDVLQGNLFVRIPGKQSNCPQCPFATITTGNLKIHMKTCHKKPVICSPPNNKIQKILNEDISIEDESDMMAIEMENEVTTHENGQTVIEKPSEKETEEEHLLIEATNDKDGEKSTLDEVTSNGPEQYEASESSYICAQCELTFESQEEVEKHVLSHTVLKDLP